MRYCISERSGLILITCFALPYFVGTECNSALSYCRHIRAIGLTTQLLLITCFALPYFVGTECNSALSYCRHIRAIRSIEPLTYPRHRVALLYIRAIGLLLITCFAVPCFVGTECNSALSYCRHIRAIGIANLR